MCRVIPGATRGYLFQQNRGNLKPSSGRLACKHQNGGETRFFGGKLNFARAHILSGGVLVLWVIVFVTTERKTSSTANDATGSSPVRCSSGTTQIRTKDSSFPARKTLAKSCFFSGFPCRSKLVRSQAKCTAFIIYQDRGEIST